MKKALFSISSLVLAVSVLPSMSFANDVPPNGSVPLSKVVDNIYAKGYDDISKIEYDDGVYKAKVVGNGQKQYLYIDPTKGSVKAPKPANPDSQKMISMPEAIKSVPEDRCQTLTEVKNEAAKKGYYKIKCLNHDNQELEVYVDSVSGKVSRISFD